MLAGLLAAAMLVMKLFPETPFARLLHLYLVELPIKLARRIKRTDVILVVIILCAGQTLALAGSFELAMAYAVDLSIYADAVVATYLAALSVRLKNAWWATRSRVTRLLTAVLRPRPRSRRTKRTIARRDDACNDDDHPASWVALAA